MGVTQEFLEEESRDWIQLRRRHYDDFFQHLDGTWGPDEESLWNVALAVYQSMMPLTTSYTLYRAHIKAHVPSKKKPKSLTRDGPNRRVDECTLILWQCGKSNSWDVTIHDNLAQSHLPKTPCDSGSAAEDASARKISKTGEGQRYDFVAIACRDPGPNE